MSDTPVFALPLLAASQAQKHVTLNESLGLLDSLSHPVIASRSLTAPPTGFADGSVYLVAAGASGAWTGQAGRLAIEQGGGWLFRAVPDGFTAWIADERRLALHVAGVWTTLMARTAFGATTTVAVLEETLTLSGSVAVSSILMPARSIVLAVSCRTVTAITGAPSYGCGIAGETTKFGGGLGVAAGAVNIGVIGPSALYADTAIRLTPTSGSFTAGSVRIAAHLLVFTPPTA